MSRAARCLAAATGALLLCAPTALEAQRAPPADSTRGWLGIGLRETLDCPSEWPGPVANRRRDCSSAFVVRAVFRSSPAQRAGVAPGDTLLEVAGARLGTEAAAERLRELRPGERVELLLGREGRRRSVTVTPAPRPPAPGPVAVRVGRPEAPERVSVAVRPRVMFGTGDSVFRVELPEAPEIVFGTEDLEGIRVDAEGRVFLERGGEQLVRLRQLERLAPRLRAVSDSALEMARERLRAVRAELRREERDGAAAAWAWGPSGPHRALGAELWTVSPELARSLRNVDHGMLVLKVLPATPAAELGLQGGDVLVRIGDSDVRTPRDLRVPFDGDGGRTSVPVRWIREGETMVDTLRTGG